MPHRDGTGDHSPTIPSVSTSDLVDKYVNGRSFDIVGLLGTLLGGVVLAVYDGVMRVILAAFDVPSALIDGLADWLSTFVWVLIGMPAAIVNGSFTELIATAGSAGIAGFAVGVVIVGFLMYEVAEVL